MCKEFKQEKGQIKDIPLENGTSKSKMLLSFPPLES
jgi:hypothetical protein